MELRQHYDIRLIASTESDVTTFDFHYQNILNHGIFQAINNPIYQHIYYIPISLILYSFELFYKSITLN